MKRVPAKNARLAAAAVAAIVAVAAAVAAVTVAAAETANVAAAAAVDTAAKTKILSFSPRRLAPVRFFLATSVSESGAFRAAQDSFFRARLSWREASFFSCLGSAGVLARIRRRLADGLIHTILFRFIWRHADILERRSLLPLPVRLLAAHI